MSLPLSPWAEGPAKGPQMAKQMHRVRLGYRGVRLGGEVRTETLRQACAPSPISVLSESFSPPFTEHDFNSAFLQRRGRKTLTLVWNRSGGDTGQAFPRLRRCQPALATDA